MTWRTLCLHLLLFASAVCSVPAAFAQVPIGVQVKASTLGLGGEVGVRLAPRANLRAGFNLFNYNHTFDNDGITYDGKLAFRSVTANVDLYLVGPLHFSPGLLLYNGLKGTAVGGVPGGQRFTLGGTTYQSSTANPLHGDLAINVNKVAPELLIGIGNLVPQNSRFTINLDAGVVFQGAPESHLTLTGLACLPPNSSGPTCVDAATNSIVQSNARAQEAQLNDDFSLLRYYPVISFGIGFRF